MREVKIFHTPPATQHESGPYVGTERLDDVEPGFEGPHKLWNSKEARWEEAPTPWHFKNRIVQLLAKLANHPGDPSLPARIKETEEDLAKVEHTCESLETQLQDIQEKLAKAHEAIVAAQEAHALARVERERTQRDLSEAKQKRSELRSDLTHALPEHVPSAKKEFMQLKAKLKEAEAALAEAEEARQKDMGRAMAGQTFPAMYKG